MRKPNWLFSTKRTYENHTNCKCIIKEKNEIKYLRVTLDRKLYFASHIYKIRNRTKKTEDFLYSYINKLNPLNKTLKIRLYKTYIRSIMLYAASDGKNTDGKTGSNGKENPVDCTR